MNRISFKNRIALYFSISTALLVFIVFVVIYVIVKSGVYRDIDNDLDNEVKVLFNEINVTSSGFSIADEEWEEKEHNTLDINPIFIQFRNAKGISLIKSPNLKGVNLEFNNLIEKNGLYYNTFLNGSAVRQFQIPVYYKTRIVGHIIVATPLEDVAQLLKNLRKTLFIAYPAILMVLFSIARIMAGRSIKPVMGIIDTTEKITQENLDSRIPLPHNKDELYTLSKTINALLNRIENAVIREKQFTSDASHELRTPLAVIKGTLEVLIRKPRDREEYEEKIKFCLAEVNRINTIIDQLFLLARFESQKQMVKKELVNINAMLYDITARHSQDISNKELKVTYHLNKDMYSEADEYLLFIIFDNLIGNAVKYTGHGGHINIAANFDKEKTCIKIEDTGIGIPKKDLQYIFTPFFRSKSAVNNIDGSGIGLSIVKRLCELLGYIITIESEPDKGTSITINL